MTDLIYSYSRKEAIADGVLRDCSELAREAGFRYPVAVTVAVWADCVAVPPACPWQDETGRLYDILTMLRYSIRSGQGGELVNFQVLVQNDESAAKLISLKALCGPGDDERPVITIMFPDES